jgi:hypothetical protein
MPCAKKARQNAAGWHASSWPGGAPPARGGRLLFLLLLMGLPFAGGEKPVVAARGLLLLGACVPRHWQTAVLRLRGAAEDDAQQAGAPDEGPEDDRPPLPVAGALDEGRERLQDAMGLMASLDREIDAAQAKVAELGLEDDEPPLADDQGTVGDGTEAPAADGRARGVAEANITARINALEAEKAELEARIARQSKELENLGAPAAEVGNFWDTHVPVVDAEGFPRGDIPVEEVLRGRARLAGLRNRYKEVMDRLQVALGDYFTSFE